MLIKNTNCDMMNKTHETIFTKKYLYDGIQNIEFSDKSRIVYLQKMGDRVYIDVKFTEESTYEIYADIEFNKNVEVKLQTGIIYPGFIQHPKTLSTTTILNPNTTGVIPPISVSGLLIGKVTLLPNQGLIQPVFIRNATNLQNKIHIKSIKIVGPHKIEYVYTEWWNKVNNTGKRPYQHANHIVSNSIFDNILNPRHVYKEMIILKWHRHTYATAINGPSTYMGIDFSEGRIVFSVWHAIKDDGTHIPNLVTEVGKNVESKPFTHEGSGSYFTLRYNKFNSTPLMIGHKYGFYIYYNDRKDGTTEYSAYFINLGPVDKPISNPEWILIGKVLHYASYNVDNRIGGFLENFMTANGHLYQRSVAIGNAWASTDGITWVPSSHEEAVMDDLNMQQATTYTTPNAGFIIYSIGGRLGTEDNERLLKHGEKYRSYDIYRTQEPTIIQPSHLATLPFFTDIESPAPNVNSTATDVSGTAYTEL